MALISYAPATVIGGTIFGDKTIGPVTGVTKTANLPGTGGTLPVAPPVASYPAFNTTGNIADAGEIADCLNQLVVRIEALEAILAANPAYGIVAV